MVLDKNLFKKEEIISSFNFARSSDIVYAEVIPINDFKKIESENTFIINRNSEIVFYKIRNFEVSENSIIFCNLYMVDSLFSLLKDINNLVNLKLITGQSDNSITKKLFLSKPNCISEWYSTNVAHSDKNLIPIPLGLANDHPKNLSYDNFINNKEKPIKQDIAYLNFENNTNFIERKRIQNKLKNKKWSYLENNKIGLNDYLTNLKKYKYIIAPPGNGVDTHRIWESLYAGSYPVVNKNISIDSFSVFPIIFVDNLSKISFEQLENLYNKIETKNLQYLNINWWLTKIKKRHIQSRNSVKISESEYQLKYSLEKYNKKFKKEKRIKSVKTIIRKVLAKFNY